MRTMKGSNHQTRRRSRVLIILFTSDECWGWPSCTIGPWPQAWSHEPERPGPDARSLRTIAKEGREAHEVSVCERYRGQVVHCDVQAVRDKKAKPRKAPSWQCQELVNTGQAFAKPGLCCQPLTDAIRTAAGPFSQSLVFRSGLRSFLPAGFVAQGFYTECSGTSHCQARWPEKQRPSTFNCMLFVRGHKLRAR